MNRQMKMRCQQKSHLLPPVALLQLLLTALLVFAAGGGSYNLSVTDTKTGDILPIMATTNSSGGRTYITNYVVIKVPQGVTFTVTPTDTSYTNKSWDFHDAGTPNHINGTNETVMVHFASTNTPITNTPVTIVSSRVDDTGRTCKTTQTVIHLLPERFRLINGDTNTADIDGKDFNHDRPTTISETSNYVTPALVSAATGHSPPIGGGNDGLDVIGVDVPLGQGRPDHQGQCDTISLMMLAKVNGDTNTADIDGKDFNYNRPTKISDTISYATSTLVANAKDGNGGLDVIGTDLPLGSGLYSGYGYTSSIMLLAKVSPTNSAPLTYAWGRVYQDQSVTITKNDHQYLVCERSGYTNRRSSSSSI